MSVTSVYLRVYDHLLARPGVALLAVVGVALAASTMVPRIGLDMSFRPLFGQDAEALEATRAFEERFGQRSGAYVGVVLKPDAWDRRFVARLAAASQNVQAVEGVSEVVSLTHAVVPEWSADGVTSRQLVQDAALHPVTPSTVDLVLGLRDAPELQRVLVSPDGARTVLMARLDVPLQDLPTRARIIERLREIVHVQMADVAQTHWVGISVVEAAYARLVLSGIALSLVLTTVALLLALLVAYRRVGAVAAIMAGVSLSLPVAVAAMVGRGQSITIVNSMVPTMVLIIGVADAIHMFECYVGHVRRGRSRDAAVRAMFGDMALPCLLTSATTIVGVLALETARIAALRDFGLNVAIGIVAVYLANSVALPALLRLLPVDRVVAPPLPWSPVARFRRATARVVVRRPGGIALTTGLAIGLCALGVRSVAVDQRFNEDVSPRHPVRVAQDVFERDFSGVLGPDLEVRRRDGAPVLGRDDRVRLRRAVDRLADVPGVIRVESVLDLMTEQVDDASRVLSLREDPRLGPRARDVLAADGTSVAIAVMTADVGSSAALRLAREVQSVADDAFGNGYEVRVVGQWWLAQLGLADLLRDMLVSFGTSFAFVLPLLALALRNVRLFAVALVPNVLPPLFALGFMGWAGISVRVGTAMVLAIALAIVVDDTIHVLVRLARERREGRHLDEQVGSAIEHTAGPLLLTTIVLVAGFASMLFNGLVAIRDMGLVAGATVSVALVADLYLLPALYLLSNRLPTWGGSAGYVERRMTGRPVHGRPSTVHGPSIARAIDEP